VAGDYANVEIDLATGRHHRRGQAAEDLLKELTGAEAATVLNNTAGATMTALAAVAAGREVVIARGQMIEMGCSYQLPKVIAAAGAVACEVGTANKTRLSDYERAVGPATAALLAVRVTNFETVGAAGAVAPKDLVELGRKKKLPAILSLGYAALTDMAPFGLPNEPVVAKCIAAGADAVLFSGDKLVGGPQCGIVVGRRETVEAIQQHPLARAMRVDGATLAALVATLDLYRDAERAAVEIPLLERLATPVDNLRNRAERLAPQIEAAEAVQSAEVVETTTTLAGNATAGHTLPTCAIAIEPQGATPERLAGRLRQGDPPVIARVDGDRLLLDLRSVAPRHDVRLVEAIEALTHKSDDAEAPAE